MKTVRRFLPFLLITVLSCTQFSSDSQYDDILLPGQMVEPVLMEAEAGNTDGTIIDASNIEELSVHVVYLDEFTTITTQNEIYTAWEESSAGGFVTLAPGQSWWTTSLVEFDALILKISVPDNATGTEQKTDIQIYIDDSLVSTVQGTTKFTWVYSFNGIGTTNDWDEVPDPNEPYDRGKHAWDEIQWTQDSVMPAGSRIKIMNPASSKVPISLDLIEMEYRPAPVEFQEGYWLDFSKYNPDKSGTDDITGLLTKAAWDAVARNQVLYIPPGRYRIGYVNLPARIIIQGAGMWWTKFVGEMPHFQVHGLTRVADFSVFGEVTIRNDLIEDNNGFDGTPGPGSLFTRIWIEHTKCGFWVTGGSDFRINGWRVRNTLADGINLFGGVQNATVDNCNFRNTGDDSLASWPLSTEAKTNTNIRFEYNTIHNFRGGNAELAIFGGGPYSLKGNKVYGNIKIFNAFNSYEFNADIQIEDTGIYGGHLIVSDNKSNWAGRNISISQMNIQSDGGGGISLYFPNGMPDVNITGLTVVDALSAPLRCSAPTGRIDIYPPLVLVNTPENWDVSPGVNLTFH